MMKNRFLSGVLCVVLVCASSFAAAQSGGDDGAAAASDEAQSGEPVPSVANRAKTDGNGPEILNVPGLSKGVDAIVAEIRKREVGIALREQRVAERERAVVELESLVESRAMELDRIRQEVEDRIMEWSAQGQDRVDQLSSVYSSMPPVKAGDLLSKLDLDLAVSVIRSMKKKSSAGVLAAMRPDRALEVSRRLLKPLDPKTDAPAARRK
ncbi:MAG: MotE family protein [Myxococcota bacterium]